jgi:predicted RNA-binding protein YlqC (UPF0109 family)
VPGLGISIRRDWSTLVRGVVKNILLPFPWSRTPVKELLQRVVETLVTKPEAIEITETLGETTTILELRVAKEDLGRVIGKQGRTARSLRTILQAVAARNNRKVTLEILE